MIKKILLFLVLIFIASCSQGIVYEQEEFVENDLSIDNFREEVKEVETQIDRKNDAIMDFYENNRGSSINLRFLEVNSNSFDFYISQKEEIDISIIGGSKTCNVERNFFAQKGDNTIDFSFCNLEKGEYEILIETSSGNRFEFELFIDENVVEGEVKSQDDGLVSESLSVGNQSQEKITVDTVVYQIYVMDTSDGEITSEEDTYFVVLWLARDSDLIEFSDLILKLDTQTGTQTVEYSSTSNFSSEEYKVEYINNGGNALVEGFLSPRELVLLSFNAKENLSGDSFGTIRLLTSNSAVKPVEFTTPSSMVEETTYLYP